MYLAREKAKSTSAISASIECVFVHLWRRCNFGLPSVRTRCVSLRFTGIVCTWNSRVGGCHREVNTTIVFLQHPFLALFPVALSQFAVDIS
jgi:hypothetical protein